MQKLSRSLYRWVNRILICLAASMTVSSVSHAQTVTSMQNIFSGPNIYANNVIYDSQDGMYKMWYGGWQSNIQSNDYIYYRASFDGITWYPVYFPILTPEALQSKYKLRTGETINVQHVNNPSVTKHFNVTNGQYQYTMFFTVCVYPCNAADNQIWSMVSSDGVNWDYPIKLALNFQDNSGGPIAANVVQSTNGPAGTFWRVQTGVSVGSGNSIYLIHVSGDRVALDNPTKVFTSSSGLAQNPSRIYVDGKYYMFFNSANTYGGYNVNYVTSSDDETWGGETVLIAVNNSPICAAQTPQALATGMSTFNLYMSWSLSSSGTCNFAANSNVVLWQWSIP